MDKKEKIFDTALKLFVKDGFHGTPTSKIAKEAGIANGTLFHHFKTKDILIKELYLKSKEEINDYIEEHIKGDLNPKTKFKALYISSLNWSIDHSDKFQFILLFQSSPFLKLIPQETLDQQSQSYYKVLNECYSKNLFTDLPLDYIYTLLLNHFMGNKEYIIQNSLSQEERKNLINTSFDLLWRMIS
ncbi:TetR/AcrR family transcriptional regulator [Aureivirga marina]|uniref:TetR/AcrR family transcriptional regulator n=1 Tax=Aureivirga marina TaxID=1182451 RepID=UPI0018C8DDBB|nr:TetR/AcrR family transcriptional regulator [Aureivirga marina]